MITLLSISSVIFVIINITSARKWWIWMKFYCVYAVCVVYFKDQVQKTIKINLVIDIDQSFVYLFLDWPKNNTIICFSVQNSKMKTSSIAVLFIEISILINEFWTFQSQHMNWNMLNDQTAAAVAITEGNTKSYFIIKSYVKACA